MKKFQFWTLALTTLLFGACSDDKTAPQPQPEGTASISVRVSGTPTAKATGSSHNAHESIDIKIDLIFKVSMSNNSRINVIDGVEIDENKNISPNH